MILSLDHVNLIESIKLLVFDFDGVFTDNKVYVDQEGNESVCCSKYDSMGIAQLRNVGWDMMVLSSEVNPVVSARCKKLKVMCHQGVEAKVILLDEIISKKGLHWREVLFMGNDINDAECLSKAGLPVVVADAHQDVISLAKWVTRAPGGNGAVREVCDAIWRLNRRMRE